MATDANCIFCKLLSGEIPTTILGSNQGAIAFNDHAPRAKVHILVVPREHHRDVVELADSSPQELHDVITLANEMAKQHTGGSFRLTFNTGEEAGQTVFHAHAHVTAISAKASA